MSEFSWSQLYKSKKNISVNINKEYIIGNFNFYILKKQSQKGFFPMLNINELKLYNHYGIFPQYFGKDFKDGIFQRKLGEEEKIQLQKIISETENSNHK